MRTGRFGGRQLGPARKARHRDATILRQWSTDRTYCLVRADTIADCSKTWHKPPGAIKARVPLAGDQGGDSYRFRSGGQCGSWRWPGPHSPSSKMGSCGQDRPAASVGLSPPFETRVATAVSIFRGRSAGRSERPHPVADPRKVTVAPRGFRHRLRLTRMRSVTAWPCAAPSRNVRQYRLAGHLPTCRLVSSFQPTQLRRGAATMRQNRVERRSTVPLSPRQWLHRKCVRPD